MDALASGQHTVVVVVVVVIVVVVIVVAIANTSAVFDQSLGVGLAPSVVPTGCTVPGLGVDQQ